MSMYDEATQLNKMASNSVSAPPDQQTKSTPSIEFDPAYAKSFNGILKIVQVVLSLIGFICIQSVPHAAHYSAVGWYSFVAMTSFWVTLILLFFYLFHVIEKLTIVPWLLCEMVYGAVWCACFFIAATVAASKGTLDAAFGAAAFFGFAAMFAFGLDAFFKFKKWRSGDQGEATQQEGSTTSPPSHQSTPSYPAY